MSRAFVKEDAPSEEVFVPMRAPLPPDSPNYVTPRGLHLLESELASLHARRAELKRAGGEERERARQQAVVDGRVADLQQRLGSAQVTPLPEPTPAEVVFGSWVTVRVLDGKFQGETRSFAVVGVDEAGEAGDDTRVAFTAPIARALLGRKVGERAKLVVAGTPQVLEVVRLGRPEG